VYAAYALAIGRDEGPEEEDLTEDRTGTPEVGGDTGEEPISVGINEMDVDAEDPGPVTKTRKSQDHGTRA
jgi:hypothetical protein